MGQALLKTLSWGAPLFMGKVLMGDRKQKSFSHFRPELYVQELHARPESTEPDLSNHIKL